MKLYYKICSGLGVDKYRVQVQKLGSRKLGSCKGGRNDFWNLEWVGNISVMVCECYGT